MSVNRSLFVSSGIPLKVFLQNFEPLELIETMNLFAECGGVVVSNPDRQTLVLSRSASSNSRFAVIDVNWLHDCVTKNRLLDLIPYVLPPANSVCPGNITKVQHICVEDEEDVSQVVSSSRQDDLAAQQSQVADDSAPSTPERRPESTIDSQIRLFTDSPASSTSSKLSRADSEELSDCNHSRTCSTVQPPGELDEANVDMFGVDNCTDSMLFSETPDLCLSLASEETPKNFGHSPRSSNIVHSDDKNAPIPSEDSADLQNMSLTFLQEPPSPPFSYCTNWRYAEEGGIHTEYYPRCMTPLPCLFEDDQTLRHKTEDAVVNSTKEKIKRCTNINLSMLSLSSSRKSLVRKSRSPLQHCVVVSDSEDSDWPPWNATLVTESAPKRKEITGEPYSVAEYQKKMNYLVGKDAIGKALGPSMWKQAKAEGVKSVRYSHYKYDHYTDDPFALGELEKLERERKITGNPPKYSQEERYKMIQYLIENNAISKALGLKIWQKMEADKILLRPYRSANGLVYQFRSYLRDNYMYYTDNAEALKEFEKFYA